MEERTYVHELASYPSCWRITIPPFEGLLSLRPEGRLATGKGKGRLWRILVRPSEPLYICVVLTNGQISFRGTPIDNDILCPSFIPFNHLPFCLAVSRSFLVHSCSFVPPLYIRGEEQNHRNRFALPFRHNILLGHYRSFFFGLFCRKMPISKHLTISLKTFKCCYSNI